MKFLLEQTIVMNFANINWNTQNLNIVVIKDITKV